MITSADFRTVHDADPTAYHAVNRLGLPPWLDRHRRTRCGWCLTTRGEAALPKEGT